MRQQGIAEVFHVCIEPVLVALKYGPGQFVQEAPLRPGVAKGSNLGSLGPWKRQLPSRQHGVHQNLLISEDEVDNWAQCRPGIAVTCVAHVDEALSAFQLVNYGNS